MKVLAYGSLLNRASLERSLKRPATLSPMQINGYQRVFNAPFDQYAFLNLQANPRVTIEAAYFELEPEELDRFAEREAGSELVEVAPEIWAFIWPARKCRELPVLQSYIDVCETGASELGINIWHGIIRPAQIIDDREFPRYL